MKTWFLSAGDGVAVNHKKVAKMMRKMGIQVKKEKIHPYHQQLPQLKGISKPHKGSGHREDGSDVVL
ncbi:MAG: IS3 family transposase [Actinomycetia bacterium]|nr:IS3 family transposase [Actinomycetes bacterium]